MPNPSELERVLCEVHPLGILLIHTNPYLPRWISRQDSNSADARLREMGWQRIAPWTIPLDKLPVMTLVRYVGEERRHVASVDDFTVGEVTTYRGKKGCVSVTCTRIMDGLHEDSCYGWHCVRCHAPTDYQGHDCDVAPK